MTKFLTRHGRNTLGLILVACSLSLLLGIVLTHLKPEIAPPDSWIRGLGRGLQLATALALLGLAIYFAHSGPTARDFLEAAEQTLGEIRRSADFWAVHKFKRFSFRELSLKEKVMQIAIFAFGAILTLTGVADLAGMMPGYLPLPAAEGGVKAMPHWMSGLVFFLSGFICFAISFVFREKIVDRWDEELKKLLEEGEKE